MNRFVFAATMSLAGLVAGCGGPTVQATYIPFEKFEGQSCAQLDRSMDEAQARFDAATRGPDPDAKPDALTTLATGISKIRGGPALEASAARGDINTITVAQIRNRCKGF